jgi:mannose-1-phosphate guanylyltransferase/mannose-6-phosphate isomerase
MHCLILCGGSGTRLWPLSRKNYPKQFLKLLGDYSLLQQTYLRMKKIIPAKNIFFITNQENFFSTLHQIRQIEKKFDDTQIIVEPASLNTAPALALGVKYLTDRRKIKADEPIIEAPSDHHIKNEKEFCRLAKMALNNLNNNVGAIGMVPEKIETGYGYIKKGEKKGSHFSVSRFIEKPNYETASGYVASGDYLWNAGIYLFTPKTLARELKLHAPEIYSIYKENYHQFIKGFISLKPVSFDNAVSEKSKKLVVFEGKFGWSDIGSFDALAEAGDRSHDRHISINSKNIYAKSATNKLIATIGVEDLIIIENDDSILIQRKGHGQDVKKIVEHLKDKCFKELEHNLFVHRPWGRYEVLIDKPRHKVKKITVYPGAYLSLQSHNRRAEHWVVIKGAADIVNGDKKIRLKENESTYIPIKTKHRLGNPGKADLEIIEVQTGDYLEEDDIKRYDDVYNRM